MTTPTDDLAQALRVIRQHVARDPSALAASIMATCDAALAAHESRAQPASVPDPDWLANLRHELRRSKITHNFTLTRDELAYILGDPLLAPLPAQPASADEPRFFIDHGVIHDRKRGRHILGSQNDADTFGEPLQDTVDALNAMEAATKEVGGLRADYLDECRSQAQPASVADGPDAAIYAEIWRAIAKFPTWPTDPLHALAVLGEEYGELTKAVLQATYEPHKNGPDDVRDEAIQTAAMAVRFVRSLPRYQYARCEQHSQAAMAQESGE